MKHLFITVMLFFFLTASAIAATVNINTADQKALGALPGVGSVKAETVIAYRAEHKFKSVNDLPRLEVLGKDREKLKKQISIKGK